LKLGSIKPFIEKAMQPPSLEAVDHAIDMLFDLVSYAFFISPENVSTDILTKFNQTQ